MGKKQERWERNNGRWGDRERWERDKIDGKGT